MPRARRTKRGQWRPSDASRSSANVWPADNLCREDLATEREQRIWDLQAELDKLHGQGQEALQLSKLGEAIAYIYPHSGRPEQLEALRWLIFERKDMILVAKTSAVKRYWD